MWKRNLKGHLHDLLIMKKVSLKVCLLTTAGCTNHKTKLMKLQYPKDPLDFLMFINDLPEKLSSNVKLFADDCIVYRKIAGSEDAGNL